MGTFGLSSLSSPKRVTTLIENLSSAQPLHGRFRGATTVINSFANKWRIAEWLLFVFTVRICLFQSDCQDDLFTGWKKGEFSCRSTSWKCAGAGRAALKSIMEFLHDDRTWRLVI